MAGPYYVDSHATGGDGSGGSFTNAFLTFKAMQDYGGTGVGPGTTTNRLASGEIIYVASDHDDSAASYAAHTYIYGPSSGAPAKIISVNSSTELYEQGTTNQFDMYGKGAYHIGVDGHWVIYGFRPRLSNTAVTFATLNGSCTMYNCYLMMSQNSNFAPQSFCVAYNLTMDFTGNASAGGEALGMGNYTSHLECHGLTLANMAGRTADFVQGTIYTHEPNLYISGADLSGWTGSALANVSSRSGMIFEHCKLASATPAWTGTINCPGRIELINCSTENVPYLTYIKEYRGTITTSTSIYLDAAVEGTSFSWAMVGVSGYTAEGTPLKTPWIYGVVSSTGAKTFTVEIANSQADLYDDEVWLEVDYLGTAGQGLYSYANDKRTTVTTTHALQTDDDSAWTGSPGSYLQKLVVSGTVNTTGLFRARVCYGAYNAGATLYVNPKVTVT